MALIARARNHEHQGLAHLYKALGGGWKLEVIKMVYAIQESLVCVFAVIITAALAFIFCAAMVLTEEALRHAYRALQEAGGVISRLVVDRCVHCKGKVLPADVRSPLAPANIPILGAERAKS